jgi:hypothetical protein
MTELLPNGVEKGSCVAFGENKAIILASPRPRRIKLHMAKEKSRDEIRGRTA